MVLKSEIQALEQRVKENIARIERGKAEIDCKEGVKLVVTNFVSLFTGLSLLLKGIDQGINLNSFIDSSVLGTFIFSTSYLFASCIYLDTHQYKEFRRLRKEATEIQQQLPRLKQDYNFSRGYD